MTVIDDLITCEFEQFSTNNYRGVSTAPEHEFVSGMLPVMVSAPHSVTHVRNGRIKPSEDYTGAIALAVAKESKCHAIVATRTGEGDPNWDALESSPYKQDLCEYVRANSIQVVFDLHGMVAASPALVVVGSAGGSTVSRNPGLDARVTADLRNTLVESIERFGKPIVLNAQYAACGHHTVVNTVARECAEAIACGGLLECIDTTDCSGRRSLRGFSRSPHISGGLPSS